MRSTRNQPFAWQEKKILRLLRIKFSGSELGKYRNLYCTITEIDSDFNSKDIKYYTKLISTYSGLSKEWIPTGLKEFEKMGILKIIEEKENGKFKGKRLIFTPENIKEIPPKPVTGKPVNGESNNGESFNGKTDTLEDSSLLEDSPLLEDNSLLEEGQKENLKNSFKEPEKEKKIPDISPDDDFILKLKNTPEFKKALNDFCIIKTDFEKIGNQVIKLALKHRATIEEIVDSLRICHKQNKSGIIPYFGGVLKRKILNRAGGDNEPASAQQKDMPKPKKPHIINAIQKTQITDFIHDGLLKYNKVITYSIDWNNLNIKILFIDKNNRTQLRTIDEVVTKCRNLFGIFVNTKVLN